MKKSLFLLILSVFLTNIFAADSTLATYTYNLQKGWNLIGLTLEPTEESEQELLSHRIYEYNSDKSIKAYCMSGEIVAGKAYWVFSEQNESLVVRGTPAGDAVSGESAAGTYRLVVGDISSECTGVEITVSAPDKEGHSFIGWTVDGVSIPDTTQQTVSFTMPSNNVLLGKNYSVNSYQLTVNGNVSTKAYGESVSVTAATKTGYAFKDWTVDGVTISSKTSNTLTFTMPANSVTLTANYDTIPTMDYMVVNLSTGDVRYTETAPDISDDTCRTTELWLRRIPAGTFTMGSPADEVGRAPDEIQHGVTLTQDYYIGVFECTQRQWELIKGNRPSYFNNDSYYATRPVENVSYDDIRGTGSTAGTGWPAYGHAVDNSSFMGKLRAKTGLIFDLPTEAQWEHACRRVKNGYQYTALNTGKNLASKDYDSAMDAAGRYKHNGGENYDKNCDTTHGTAKVGSYLPSDMGLYDMHGNVHEWCLDWYGSYSTGAVTDSTGASSGSYRVLRGGYWSNYAHYCRSAHRGSDSPSRHSSYLGFRVVCLPQ